MLYSRVQTMLQRRRKQKRALEISAPFDLKCEPVSLPGISQDELAMLRKKAAASRIGVFKAMPPSYVRRRKAPRPSPGPVVAVLPPHAAVPVW